MIIITREKAASCTDRELRSALKKLYNALAAKELPAEQRRSANASIEVIHAELRLRGPR